MDKIFKLTVRSREGVVFEGDVNSITSFNDKGIFDVLAMHANFITLIKNKLTVRDTQGKIKDIEVKNGLMRVRDNIVEVYLGVEEFKVGY
jgi:F0F1-type ATP synthase epsilon subunit